MHLLASFMPYHVALSKEVPPQSLGLSGQKKEGLMSSALTPVRLQPVEQ